MKSPSLNDRKALGSFLSSRRGRLRPEDLGLPTGQRRTPGLRREEVAALAGVSVSWYTWLEQGRDINASSAALQRLARVLRFDRAEVTHLFALSSHQSPAFTTVEGLSDGLVALVKAIDPIPTYVRNSRLDVLAWNPAVADLFVDFGRLEPAKRNTLWLTFLYPPYRDLMRDWERFARATLRIFYAARAKAPDKAPFDLLVEEIERGSEQFRAWWQEGDVQTFEEGTKRLRHPRRGLIDLTYVVLIPEGQPDLSFVTYTMQPGRGD